MYKIEQLQKFQPEPSPKSSQTHHPSQLQCQISQLCKLILIFQQDIEPYRQRLFLADFVTDDNLWNGLFGSAKKKISSEELCNFVKKYNKENNKIYGKKKSCFQFLNDRDYRILCARYSAYRDQCLTKTDFWQLFKPKKLPHLELILKSKKKRIPEFENLQLQHQLKQKIIQIINKTVQFQLYAQKMKRNIQKYRNQFDKFLLKSIQAKYLQLYINMCFKEIRLKDCELILEHIVGIYRNKQKAFYSYFLSQRPVNIGRNPVQEIRILKDSQKIDKGRKYGGSKIKGSGNKDGNWEGDGGDDLQDFYDSKKIWNYGWKYNSHKKPLYLI